MKQDRKKNKCFVCSKIAKLWNNIKVRKIRLLIIFIIIPLAIAFVLFPPWEKIDLGYSDKEEITIQDEVFAKLSLRSLMADALQVPLGLKWYTIYIVDKSTVEYENCLKLQPVIMRLIFDKGNPEKYLKTSLEKNQTLETGKWIIYELSSSRKAHFTYLASDDFTIRAMYEYGCDQPTPKNEEGYNKYPILKPEYQVYARPYPPSLIAKYISIFILWLVVFSSVSSTLRLCRHRNRIKTNRQSPNQ